VLVGVISWIVYSTRQNEDRRAT